MARGGPREGAGRRKGSRNRRTREVLEALAVPNCTPLAYSNYLLVGKPRSRLVVWLLNQDQDLPVSSH
jgi:hypothetical protein